MGSLSYTPRAQISLFVRRVGSLSYTPRAQIFLLLGRVGSLSYTPYTGNCLISRRVDGLCVAPLAKFCFIVWQVGSLLHVTCWNLFIGLGVSLTRPVLECLVVRQVGTFYYRPRPRISLVVRQVGTFSYTPCPGICLVVRREGVSLTRLVLQSGQEFLLNTPSWSLSCRSSKGESLLHAPC